MRPRTNSSRRIAWNAIVGAFVWAVAAAWLVPGSATAASQEGNGSPDARPAAVRIREIADRGRAERVQGRIDASIETFEKAQAVAEQVGDFRPVLQLDSEIANSLDRAGRFEQELEVLHRIEARVQERDDDQIFLAAARLHVSADLSLTLLRLGRRNEALEKARDAVHDLDTTPDPGARGAACSAMGGCMMALGRTAEARTWLRRTLEEAENLDPSDVRRIQARIDVCNCEGELGNWESALEVAEDLVNQLESLGSYPAHLGAEVYSLRGQLWFYRNWQAAEQDLRRSLVLLKAAGADEDGDLFQRATLQLAHAVRNVGRPEESAILERHALSVLREKQSATGPTAILAAQLLAASLRDLYDRSGDRSQLDESRQLLEEAARSSRDGDIPNSSPVFALLGELLLDAFYDPHAAEPWLRAAVDEIESRSSGALALDESERADLLQRRRLNKRYDPYESLLKCLVRLNRSEEALDVLEHSRARSLTDLLGRSRFDSLQQALERAEENGNETHAGRIRQLPGEIDAAMTSLARARALADSEEARAQIRRAHDQCRRLEAERAELSQSVTTAGRVSSIDEVRRSLGKDEVLLAYFLGRRTSFACVAEPPGGRIDWFELVDEDGHALTSDAVEARARAWVGALSRGLGDPARGIAPSNSLPDRNASMSLDGHRLFQWLAPPEVWQRIRDRTVVHLIPHGPLNWMPFEALIIHGRGQSGAAVYWIDEGPAIAYQESGSALAWAQRRRGDQLAAADHGLALIVADPAYGDASGHPTAAGKRPVVVQVQRGGPAAREGLLVGDEIESLAGTRVESVADFERIQRENRDPAGAPLVVVRSGIDRSVRLLPGESGLEISPSLPPELRRGSSRASAEPLERLPGTAREAKAVREALEKQATVAGAKGNSVRLLTGGEATETLLTAWAPTASILHIAAHQIPDPTGCSDSGRIALTAPPFPTAEDDGYVDLDDFLIHWRGRLDQCGLVVLSSCWSRTGRLVRDEGFFGLPLGIRFAGCPSIVSSLWPVDDAATAELMSAFYGSLGEPKTASRLAALQASKRALKLAWPDPYHWAGFVWSGSPR